MLDRAARGPKEGRGADDDREALSARDRDVEPIQLVEELDAAMGVLGGGSGHRVEDDGGLLALELVDGANSRLKGERFA